MQLNVLSAFLKFLMSFSSLLGVVCNMEIVPVRKVKRKVRHKVSVDAKWLEFMGLWKCIAGLSCDPNVWTCNTEQSY